MLLKLGYCCTNLLLEHKAAVPSAQYLLFLMHPLVRAATAAPVSVAALNGLLNILLIRMFCRHLFPFVPLAGLAAVASVLCVLSILVFNDENHSAWLSPTI